MSMISYLNHIDFFVLGVLLLAFIGIAKWRSSSNHNNTNFLLMGRSLSLPFFVATLTATWYGGILGVTQIAFLHGIYSFITQGLAWYLAYMFFALFLVPKISKSMVLSIPELIEIRFGAKARQASAVLLFFHALPMTYAFSLAIITKLVFGLSFTLSLIILVLIISYYTGKYGFKGIVISDMLLCLIMYTSVIMLICFCYYNIGNISFIKRSLAPHYFSLSKSTNSYTKMIAWFLIAISSTIIHPVFYQRCLAAKNQQTAQWGIAIAMLLWFIFDICTCLGGMYAQVLLPHAPSSSAYIFLGMQVLPHGLKGFFIAGILATIISTLDSFLLISATSLSYDLWPSKITHKHLLASLLTGAIIIIIGVFFKEDFESMWLFSEGLFASCLCIPVLLALFTKYHFTARDFFISFYVSLITFITITLLSQFYSINISPFLSGIAISFLFYLYTITNYKIYINIIKK